MNKDAPRLITILSATVPSYKGTEQGVLQSSKVAAIVVSHGHMIMIQVFGNWLTIMTFAASHSHGTTICNFHYTSNSSLFYISTLLASKELLRICSWTETSQEA
uniref:Uncharacterized protein n=1 Tax=Micrurus lemniscatus lemniscatus TaxID=129467 RepID=A0A2D4J3J8_MICLE